MWSQRVVRRYAQLRKHLKKVQLVVGLGFHSSSSEGVDHDALWLALLNEVRRPTAHALNCSVSDRDGVERIKTVFGRAYERVRLQSNRLWFARAACPYQDDVNDCTKSPN